MKVLMNIWPRFLFSHIGDYFANTEISSLSRQFQDMHFVQVDSTRENVLANLRAVTINAAHKIRLYNKNYKFLQPIFNLQCSSYLSDGYLKKIRPDVIFAHSHIPRIGNKTTVPLVAVEYLSSERYMEKVGVLQCLERDVEAKRWATEHANIIVTTTPSSKQRFEKSIPESRGRLMQIPIYMPYLEPISEEEITEKFQKKEQIRILFIGGAARRKGLPQLLKAIHILPKYVRDRIKLTVISNFQDGAVPGIELIANIYSNVTSECLAELLRKTHIFAFPTQFESYGRVIVEAMANGCAVISSNTDPQDWILDYGRSGILINPESFEEIAIGIEMLAKSEDQMLRFAISASRRFCKVFHHNVTGLQYRCAFDAAIKS